MPYNLAFTVLFCLKGDSLNLTLVSNKTCLVINTAEYFIGLRSWFLGQITDSYGCFLYLGSCQATSFSHAAKQQWCQQSHLLGCEVGKDIRTLLLSFTT